MPNVGLTEILVVLAIALLVIGPKKLPELGRSVGRAVREFRRASSTVQKELGLDDVADDVRHLRDEARKATDALNIKQQLGLDETVLGDPPDLDAPLEESAASDAPAYDQSDATASQTEGPGEPADADQAIEDRPEAPSNEETSAS